MNHGEVEYLTLNSLFNAVDVIFHPYPRVQDKSARMNDKQVK